MAVGQRSNLDGVTVTERGAPASGPRPDNSGPSGASANLADLQGADDLKAIEALTPSNDDVLQRKAGAWKNRTIAQLLVDLATPGTTFQPLDSDLTAIAALSTTAFGRALLALADAAALRTTAGLGTMATQAASAVAISGGTITGLGTPSSDSDAATKAYVDAGEITAGTGLSKSGNTLALDTNSLTEDTTPDATADTLVSYDASASAQKRVKPDNLFRSGSWTPAISFDTPGNLSVSYTVQTGEYFKIGKLVFVKARVAFTPTHTTASGNLRITGLPATVDSLSGGYGVAATGATAPTWPGGPGTQLSAVPFSGTTYVVFQSISSGNIATTWTHTTITTAVARDLRFALWYLEA